MGSFEDLSREFPQSPRTCPLPTGQALATQILWTENFCGRLEFAECPIQPASNLRFQSRFLPAFPQI